MVTLPLTGLAGILVAAAAAPWVAAGGWRHWPPRDPGVPLDAGPALLSFVFVAIVVTGMVFSDYDFTGWADPALDRGHFALRAGTTLAAAFGPAAGPHWRLVAGVIAGLLGLTVLMLVPAGRRVRDVERYRVLGLACVLAGSALAVMMSAGGFAALLLCVVFLAWGLYGWPLWSVAVQGALLAAAVAVLPANAPAIAGERETSLRPLDALARDVAAGMPRPELAERYQPILLPDGTADELSARMAMEAGAGIGPLAALAPR
jgi:HAMP domain-containing protein